MNDESAPIVGELELGAKARMVEDEKTGWMRLASPQPLRAKLSARGADVVPVR